jgi:arsenical-resistance protein 2
MAQETAWHEAYPKPRNQSPAVVSREELLQWLQDGKKPGVEFLLVDLRRVDHEVRKKW